MSIWAILISLAIANEPFFFFNIVGNHAFEFKQLKNENEKPDKIDVPKQVIYDKMGVLIINGTVPGVSGPILVDKKPLSNYCDLSPYYVFTVCMFKKFHPNQSACREGISFCYDGQLDEIYVEEYFVLPKYKNEVTEKCKEYSGFKIAMHYLPWMNKYDEDGNMFMEIKTSYMTQSYYFPMPYTKCMDLWLGNEENLLTGVRTGENDNNLIQPVKVRLQRNSALTGISYEAERGAKDPAESIRQQFIKDFTTLPDYLKMENYGDSPHLNMLYLDFRAQILSPQMMRAVVPETECNMLIRVRGNTIGECRADFKQKNFALRSYNDNQTTTSYSLTIESGVEDWQTVGQKTSESRSRSSGNEEGRGTIYDNSITTGLQKESEHIVSNRNAKIDENGAENSFGAGYDFFAGAGIGKQGAKAMGSVDGFLRFGMSDGFTNKGAQYDSSLNGSESSETTIISRNTIIEQAFKMTSTSIETQEQNKIQSRTVGVTKRTVFKWIIKVPPGKVLTPMQMQMDCDGVNVKIPWIKFVLTEEDEPLPVQDY